MPRRDLEAVTAAVQKAGRSGVRTSQSPHGGRRRDKTVALTVHVEPAVRVQIKVLAAEQETTVQALVCEGLNAIFAKHHRPEIAQ